MPDLTFYLEKRDHRRYMTKKQRKLLQQANHILAMNGAKMTVKQKKSVSREISGIQEERSAK